MFSKHKKLLLILIALVILFFAYWYFILSKRNPAVQNMNTGGLTAGVPSETKYSTTTDTSIKVDKEFVNGILALNSVNIDTSVFATEAYKRLTYPDTPFPVDYALQVGRGNPFLPIGATGRSPFNINPKNQADISPVVNSTSSIQINPSVQSTATLDVATTSTTTQVKPTQKPKPTQVNR